MPDGSVDDLLPVVAHAENSGDGAVSPKGAIGKYQIMPATARGLGVDPATLTDPAVNEGAARSLLTELDTRYKGDRQAILAAYNAGPKAADAFVAAGHDPSVLPRETQGYLQRAASYVNEPGLPRVYQQAADARAAGYSWQDIDNHLAASRAQAKAAGYSDEEIDDYLGLRPGSSSPAPRADSAPPDLSHPDLPAGIRSFAEKYLTPASEEPGYQAPPIKTAGDFFKALGWDVVDAGKIFGRPVVNGVAAIMEGLDGRMRTKEDMIRLGVEAQPVLGLFAGGPRFSGRIQGVREGEAAPTGLAAARASIPPVRDVLDAAKSVTPEGQDITPAARAVGQHFVETGEPPVEAAARAQTDPAMRDKLGGIRAVMPAPTGEPPDPLLGTLLADEAGSASINPAPRGVYPREAPPLPGRGMGDNGGPPLEADAENIAIPNASLGARLVDDAKKIFAPASRGPDAQFAAGVLRENMAAVAADDARATYELRQFGRSVAELTPEQLLDFDTAIETGDLGDFKGTPLGDFAATMRSLLNQSWQAMDTRGIAPGYIENYLKHIWQDPDRVTNYFSKRPMQGSAAFTKERTFATLREGMEAGFKPTTTNPVELSLTALNEMRRYIGAHDSLTELRDNGLIYTESQIKEMYGEHIPPSIQAINVQIARLDGERLYAPESVALLFNHAYSPGLSGRPIYDVLRNATNMMNGWQLGFSAFHAGFVTLDAATSGLAKGMQQISRLTPGEIGEGLKSVVKTPVQPFINYATGRQVINQMLGKGNYGPEVESIADAMIAAGGRLSLERQYRGSAMGSFFHSMKGSIERLQGKETGHMTLGQDIADMLAQNKERTSTITGAMVRTVAQIVPRVMDTLMSPLMEHYVPTMKAGVFADMMKDALRLNPDMDRPTLRAVAGKIWDSVDNRMGQLVYDNLFWNKSMKDFGHIGVRSLGWNIGDLREIPGGAYDFAKNLKSGGREAIPGATLKQLSTRTGYVVALPIITAFIGAVYGALKGTWNANWTLQDYFYPPTGGRDAQGGKERTSFPTYMRDVYDWYHSPGQTALNKASPIFPFIIWPSTDGWQGMLANRQWNGAAITDPRKDLATNTQDYAHFVLEQFRPFAFQGGNRESEISQWERLLGERPAPYAIREPDREKRFEERDTRAAVRKKEQMDRAKDR